MDVFTYKLPKGQGTIGWSEGESREKGKGASAPILPLLNPPRICSVLDVYVLVALTVDRVFAVFKQAGYFAYSKAYHAFLTCSLIFLVEAGVHLLVMFYLQNETSYEHVTCDIFDPTEIAWHIDQQFMGLVDNQTHHLGPQIYALPGNIGVIHYAFFPSAVLVTANVLVVYKLRQRPRAVIGPSGQRRETETSRALFILCILYMICGFFMSIVMTLSALARRLNVDPLFRNILPPLSVSNIFLRLHPLNYLLTNVMIFSILLWSAI